jgi:hypothetical protein
MQFMILHSLVFDIVGDGILIAVFANSSSKVSFSPKFASAQLLFHFRTTPEHLSCVNAFYHRYDFGYAIGWNGLHQKNAHDRYLYKSPRISAGIASLCPDRLPSQPRPHDHRILHASIWPEIPNGISIPLHYDSYVCIRSHSHFTPQAAGNTAPRDLSSLLHA